MKIAGGVIAIISGVLGIIAAVLTLFIGGVGAALESEGSRSVIGLGWAGILFAFLTILLTRKPPLYPHSLYRGRSDNWRKAKVEGRTA